MKWLCVVFLFFFFFKQKTAYEMRISDWSSDVCSSDLPVRRCGRRRRGNRYHPGRLQGSRRPAQARHAMPARRLSRHARDPSGTGRCHQRSVHAGRSRDRAGAGDRRSVRRQSRRRRDRLQGRHARPSISGTRAAVAQARGPRAVKVVETGQIDLARYLKRGDRIVWGQACGEPTTLIEALIAQAGMIGDLSAFTATSFSPLLTPEAVAGFTLSSMGAIGTLRTLTKAGKLQVIPCHVSQVGPYNEQGLKI